jgi:acyl-CoA reductase-like NAD-dependent aldehyde dehydrogenase
MFVHDELFIAGQWRTSGGQQFRDVVSPSTEEVVGRVPLAVESDVDLAVTAARETFDSGVWRSRPLSERRAVLREVARLLEPQTEELGRMLTLENGMLLRSGHGALGASINRILDFPYPTIERRETSTGEDTYLVQEPLGVVAAIVPWNGPNSSIFKVIPALLAGCSVVLKPAPELTLFTFVLAQAFMDAGLPPGVLSVVIADRPVAEYLVGHAGVDMVSLTGSTVAGRTIAEICGRQLKRVHLELGGKSAVVVLDDVDAGETMPLVLRGGVAYLNGEACAAWTRILLPRSRCDELTESAQAALAQLKVGDPFDPQTDLGPLVSERQRDRVEGYVELARQEGASVLAGGRRPPALTRGWYYEPTLLLGDNQMRSSREEIFGPVATIIPYDTVEEAISIANDSPYGLSGGVFSRDVDAAARVAARIRSGSVGVNCVGVSLDIPFGGVKESGFGRHFGPEGNHEFLEVKTVSVPHSLGADLFAQLPA